MAKQKFLDYSGLSRYNDLILSLIKSGDVELLNAVNEVRDLIEGSDGDSVYERLDYLMALLDERIAGVEDDIENHKFESREVLTVCKGDGTPMYDVDIAQALGHDYQVTLKGEDGTYYDNLRDVISASKNRDVVLSLKKREYVISDTYASASETGFSAVTLISVNGSVADGATAQPDILYGIVYQSKVEGEAPDAEHIFMRIDSLFTDVQAFINPYLAQIQNQFTQINNGAAELSSAIAAEGARAIAAENELKSSVSENASAIEKLENDMNDKIDSAVQSIVDGAPEALNTLREIAEWIASDEAGVADLISEVDANRADILAAAEAFEAQNERIQNIEDFIGVSGSSDEESLTERVEILESEVPDRIPDDEIDALFIAD